LAQANSDGLLGNYSLHDVVVPSVWADPSGSDLIQGMIYFNASSGELKFVGNSATPTTLGAVGGSSVTSTGNEKMERVSFGGATQRSNCTSTPCTIYSQSGAVASVTRSGVGLYTVNFNTGTFSDSPTCSVEAVSSSITYNCNNSGATSSSISLGCGIPSTSANDMSVDVICVGAR